MRIFSYISFVFFALFLFSNALAQTSSGEAAIRQSRLQVGKVESRIIAGGETHVFEIELPADQFVNLTVAQHTNDVAVKLIAPDETITAQTDVPLGGNFIERIWCVAQTAGVYRLQIISTEKAGVKGSYDLKLVESRPADEKARSSVAAAKLVAEAFVLQEQRTGAGFASAIEKYKEAARLARNAEDKSAEMMPRAWLGLLYYFLRQPQAALEENERALEIARDLQDATVEAQIDENFARLYSDTDPLKSIEYSTKALNLRTENGGRRESSVSLNALGAMYLKTGKPERAIEFFTRSAEIAGENEAFSSLAATESNLGAAYAALGEHQKAIENFQKALAFFHQTKITFLETTLLSNIGNSYDALGEPQKAIDYLSEALPLARTLGNKQSEAKILSNIGNYYGRLGDAGAALDNLSQALKVAREAKLDADTVTILSNLSTVFVRQNDFPKALDALSEALPLARKLNDPYAESLVLFNIGSIKLKTGNAAEALAVFNQALEIRRALNNPAIIAYTLSQIGNAYSALGDNAKALENLSLGLETIRAVSEPRAESQILFNLARVQNDLNRLDEARQNTNDAIAKIESVRARVGNQELRTLFLADSSDVYQLRTEILMKMEKARPDANFAALGLESAESARARTLLDLLSESRAAIRRDIDPKLIERETEARQTLSAKANQQAKIFADKNSTAEMRRATGDELERLTENYESVQAEIRRANPRYAALVQPAPVSVKEIQTQILDRDTVLLEYSLGDAKSYLWTIGQNSLKSYELPKRADIEIAARRVYELLTARNRPQTAKTLPTDAEINRAINDLSRMIIAPAAKELAGNRLLIVADGALQYIPFGVLSVGGMNPLVVTNEIVTLPSASTLAVLRREKSNRAAVATTASDSVGIVADPVFDASDERVLAAANRTETTDPKIEQTAKIVQRSAEESGLQTFSRLRFSRDEADGIALLAKNTNPLEIVDFAASKEAVLSGKLSRSKIVHFATHGLINSQNPELSGIVLSLVNEKGEPQDGFLRLFEIYNLSFDADLVVLSACQTALGQEIKGEGLIGLTRGFMYAGAPRLVASLWSVDDRATSELMRRFYQKLLNEKMRPAAALRAVQIEMRQNPRWRAPYFWAAFTLQGEWR